MRTFACVNLAAILSVAALSQSLLSQTIENKSIENKTVENQAKFEAADVHLSPQTRFPFKRGPMNGGGRYELRIATMVDLIATAYGVNNDKVVGGPTWLEMDRFDIVAKSPAGATPDSQKSMLQALLADRFKLAVHNDTKPVAAYALTVGKHAQLKETDGSGDAGCKFTPPPPLGLQAGGLPPVPMLLYTCHNMTMTAFAAELHRMVLADQYLNGNTVVDQTELKGAWDFSFKYTPRVPPAMGPSITLMDAIEKQLGLKLDPIKVPLPVIVVDAVNQKPTDNLADIKQKLGEPETPTEFEVADVKPSNPDFKGTRFQILPGGRVNIAAISLKAWIEQAWNITDEMLVGAPKWLDTERFDIVAKVSTTAGPGTGPQIDIDTLWTMLQGLLKDRFKLAAHNEERPVSAYSLVAVKPKLKKADPTSRTRFTEGPGADGKDPREKNPMLSRLVTCQNMTMAQFAEKLQNIAPGYIHTPVLDSTELEGSWDFTVSFSGAGMDRMVPNAGGRGGESPAPISNNAPQASDPNGSVTLFEAIEKQLGLKLEKQKRNAQVLVIDHIEQKPTDN